MRSRSWFLGVVAAGVAVALILFLWPRSTDHESELTDQKGAAKGASAGRDVPTVPPPDDPDPDGAGSDDGDGKQAGRRGADDRSPSGEVRDHRGETPTGTARPRPGERRPHVVQPSLVGELRRQLSPQIEKCGEQHAAGAEPNAEIHASVRVAVRSGVVSVLEVKVDQRGVPQASASGLIDCAREAIVAAQVRADGHADVEGHTLRLPFRISGR